MSQDDIVWVKVGWESLEKSQSDPVSCTCWQVIEVKEEEGKFRRRLSCCTISVLSNPSHLLNSFMCHRHWRHPGLDMRFVGQKDGEDQDPGNVQVTFEYLRVTFLLDLCPMVPPVRWTQVAKDPENLRRNQSAIGAIQAGASVETCGNDSASLSETITTSRPPRAHGVA